MTDLVSVQLIILGRVQGVYFRAYTARQAGKLGLTGYVRNLPNWHSVEVQAEGERNKLEKLITCLKAGPPGAKVENISADWSEYTGSFNNFSIRY